MSTGFNISPIKAGVVNNKYKKIISKIVDMLI